MNILLLEDNKYDKELLELQLRKEGLTFSISHVTDRRSYLEMLDNEFDIILADYSIPGYDAIAALEEARSRNDLIPFIIVSGTIDTDKAVSLIVDHGINDYILKDHLHRLKPSILRELQSYKTKIDFRKTQEELKKHTQELQKLSLVASNTQTGVIITDKNGYIEWINDSFTRITGFSRDEVIGIKPGHLLQGEETDRNTIIYIRESLKENIPFTTEIINYHKNGTPYWIRLNIAPVFNDQKELTNYIGVQEEITDQKTLENSLKHNLLRLRRAQRDAEIGDWSFDVRSKKIYWSDQLYQIFERDQTLGPPALNTLLNETFHALSSENLRKAVKRAIDHGESYELELSAIINGEKKFFSAIGKPTEIIDDKVTQLSGTLQDITKRKNAELDAVKAHKELSNVADNVDGAVFQYILHPDGKDEVTFVSKGVKPIYEVEPEKALEDVNSVWDCVAKNDSALLREAIQKSAETLDKLECQYKIKTARTGTFKHLKVVGTPKKLQNGAFIWNMVSYDITNLIEVQDQLIKTLNEKDTLLKELHHRVKNNLAILSGLLQLEQFAHGEDKVLQKAVNRIQSIATVHELLYSSDAMNKVHIDDYIAALIEQIRTSYKVSDEIHFNFDVKIRDLNINEAIPLGLLINELITNSIKHALTEDGEIQIIVQASDIHPEKHEFIYRDSGDGFHSSHTGGKTLGLELIHTLLQNLDAEYEFITEGKLELKACFLPKTAGAHGHQLGIQNSTDRLIN